MQIEQTLEGKLTLSGSIELTTCKQLYGFLYTKGVLTSIKLIVVNIYHSISFVGTLNKRTIFNSLNSRLSGLLTFKGDITKKTMLIFNRSIAFKSLLEHIVNPTHSLGSMLKWMRRGHH